MAYQQIDTGCLGRLCLKRIDDVDANVWISRPEPRQLRNEPSRCHRRDAGNADRAAVDLKPQLTGGGFDMSEPLCHSPAELAASSGQRDATRLSHEERDV